MNKKTYNYRFLLKFGKQEHIEALQKKGQIYMNTMAYFRKLPEETLIGDSYEGIQFIMQLKNLSISFKSGEKSIPFLKNGIGNMYPTNKIEGNIYCMYGADEDTLVEYYKDDHGILPLGCTFRDIEYMAAINNPKEFMRRLTDHLDMAGHKYKYAPVEYLDYGTYEGALNQFHKRKKYEGQNELRVYVENWRDMPLSIEIGDLSDICQIGKAQDHLNLRYRAVNRK